MEIKMYNNKSTSTTQHKEKKMSHSKYKKLSVNSLLPTIFLLTLQPLIPQISFMKKQQQRNGIMWIITFPNKQYFFTLSLLFIFHVVVYSVDVRALRFHDGFETNVLRRMGKEKKLKWKKKTKRKKISCPFSPPASHFFFFVLLFHSHTLVYLLRFFFSLTQHSHTTLTSFRIIFPPSVSPLLLFLSIYFFHSLFCHAMTWSRENYIATYFPQFPTFDAVIFFSVCIFQAKSEACWAVSAGYNKQKAATT